MLYLIVWYNIHDDDTMSINNYKNIVWFLYGYCMVLVWFLYGSCMVLVGIGLLCLSSVILLTQADLVVQMGCIKYTSKKHMTWKYFTSLYKSTKRKVSR